MRIKQKATNSVQWIQEVCDGADLRKNIWMISYCYVTVVTEHTLNDWLIEWWMLLAEPGWWRRATRDKKSSVHTAAYECCRPRCHGGVHWRSLDATGQQTRRQWRPWSQWVQVGCVWAPWYENGCFDKQTVCCIKVSWLSRVTPRILIESEIWIVGKAVQYSFTTSSQKMNQTYSRQLWELLMCVLWLRTVVVHNTALNITTANWSSLLYSRYSPQGAVMMSIHCIEQLAEYTVDTECTVDWIFVPVFIRARSETVYAGMVYWHFFGQLEIIPPLLSGRLPARYAVGCSRGGKGRKGEGMRGEGIGRERVWGGNGREGKGAYRYFFFPTSSPGLHWNK